MQSAPAQTLDIQVLLTEAQIAQEFAAALERHFLDERFFYWLPNSVAAWAALCRSQEYRNASRSLGLLQSTAPGLSVRWAHCESLCGIGCGEGSKDLPLLQAFAAAGRALTYVAADFSLALLEMAMVSALPHARQVRGVKLDVSRSDHLAALAARATDTGCILSVLGNTLGAFGPAQFPTHLRGIMRSQDRALLDGEIFAGEETLRGYDNPTNRRFAWGPLTGVGLGEQDGELRFELRPGAGGLYEVAKYFVASRDLVVRFGEHALAIARGEKLLMSSSIKYDQTSFPSFLTRAGFSIESLDRSPDGKFLLAAVAP